MANTYFQFKQFTVHQEHCAMKVTTDGCLFGAWTAFHCRQTPGTNYPSSILDIGTGTGLLSLMVSQQVNARVDAIELDESAFNQAHSNFTASPWSTQITAIHGDARSYDFKTAYDTIVSNPPFYENELRSPALGENRARHDESFLLSELMTLIIKNLQTGGRFYLLLPFKRDDEIKVNFKKNSFRILHKALVRQSTSHGPFRIMIAGTVGFMENENITNEEIIIKDAQGNYTPGFVKYLKDYYLHL